MTHLRRHRSYRAGGRGPVGVRAVAVTMIVVVALVAASCSSDEGADDASEPAAADVTTTTIGDEVPSESPPIEPFTGTDEEFYQAPDPLPAGEPGDLIRVMELSRSDDLVTAKIMYHSRDAEDRDRAVTGLVTHPVTDAPDGGWPVVATAPGTTGIAAQCGISHQAAEAPSWGVEGVRVMTDYIGLGPVGDPLHAYLSKASEGHSVIDGVRAARQLPGVEASDRWLSVGHSQGGHGALSASELAAAYGPELDLVATLALAPAAMLDRVYGGIDPIVTGILTSMSLYGGAGEHPEIDVEDYVTPELAAAAGVFESGCLGEITDALIPLASADGLFVADPRETEPARSILLENDVGTTVVDAPLFLVSGSADDRVVIDRTRDLYARLCEAGQVTEVLIVDGATHDSIIGDTSATTAAWLEARLAGEPPTDSCATDPTSPPAS